MSPRAWQREQEPPARGRSAGALSSIRTLTVGSGITPESARPTPSEKNVALAGSAIRTRPDAITAGGDFHPALRTCTKHNLASPSDHAQRLPLSRTGARYRHRPGPPQSEMGAVRLDRAGRSGPAAMLASSQVPGSRKVSTCQAVHRTQAGWSLLQPTGRTTSVRRPRIGLSAERTAWSACVASSAVNEEASAREADGVGDTVRAPTPQLAREVTAGVEGVHVEHPAAAASRGTAEPGAPPVGRIGHPGAVAVPAVRDEAGHLDEGAAVTDLWRVHLSRAEVGGAGFTRPGTTAKPTHAYDCG